MLNEKIESLLSKAEAILSENPEIKVVIYDLTNIPFDEAEQGANMRGIDVVKHSDFIYFEVSKWINDRQFIIFNIYSEKVNIKTTYEKI